MNKQDYISLITKGLTNEINLSESETLAQLRTSNQDFSSTYDDMEEIWNASGSYVPNVTFDSASAFDKFAAKYKIPTDSTTKSSNFDYKLVLISAVIALLVSSSLFFFYNNSNFKNTLTTFDNQSAQIETYEYQNGTITLSPGASISLDEAGNLTEVKGNAFFEGLDHLNLSNGQKVDANNAAAFNLTQNSETDELKFDVREGELEITDNSGSKKILNKNTSGTYNLETKSVTTKELDSAQGNNYATWSSRTLSFNATHIGQVFEEMEDFFGITINVKGSVPECHFTAPLVRNANVKELFELLHESFKFRVEQEGSTTFNVSKLKCK